MVTGQPQRQTGLPCSTPYQYTTDKLLRHHDEYRRYYSNKAQHYARMDGH